MYKNVFSTRDVEKTLKLSNLFKTKGILCESDRQIKLEEPRKKMRKTFTYICLQIRFKHNVPVQMKINAALYTINCRVYSIFGS